MVQDHHDNTPGVGGTYSQEIGFLTLQPTSDGLQPNSVLATSSNARSY